jgi:F-type H+/Na+-transporting ATPase subunit beta
LEEVKEYILTLEDEQHVLLVADRIIALSGELMTLRESLEKKTTSVITTVLIDVLGEAIDEDTPYGPLDTLLKFDFTLSKRGIYPALDPVYSSSIAVKENILEKDHLALHQRVRKLLRRYRELDTLINIQGEKILKGNDIYRKVI